MFPMPTTSSLHAVQGRHNLIEILKILQENQVGFGSVYSEQPTLNDVFLEITGKALRDKE